MALVRANLEFCEGQLNVYAYIWQELRHESLDSAAVIATNVPGRFKEALAGGDERRIQQDILTFNRPIQPPTHSVLRSNSPCN